VRVQFQHPESGTFVVVGTLAVVIKYQNTKLETAHEREIAAIKDGHAEALKALMADRDRGWSQASIWQQQAERLAERYTEATQLAADMSDEVLQRRRRTPR
jgi:glycosyltransferase A (GT-A) superfamily protein (DUF2064 family)